MVKYQDIYPTTPLLRSGDIARAAAADLLTLEYFEADPGEMPYQAFDQHHILLNLNETPHRVENVRDSDHRDFIYHKNEIVITPAGVKSGWKWHVKSKVIVITLEPAKLERFALSELGVVLTSRQLIDVPCFNDEDIVVAATFLLDALKNQATGSAVLYESLARVFLVKLIQKYSEQPEQDKAFSKSFTSKHYKRVLDYVSQHFDRTITLDAMAKQAGISPFHCSRLFKRTIGETPHQFVMAYRVEQAKRKLSDRSLLMIDVALSCGFADQAHFSRVFKRVTGRTPKAYRNAK